MYESTSPTTAAIKRWWKFGVRALVLLVMIGVGIWIWEYRVQKPRRIEAIGNLVSAVTITPPDRSSNIEHTDIIFVEDQTENIEAAVENVRELGITHQAASALGDLLYEEKGKYDHGVHIGLLRLGSSVLCELLGSHQDPSVRATAARLLKISSSASKDSVPVLVKALNDSDAQVRLDAACALVELDQQTAPVGLPTLFAASKSDNKLSRTTAAIAIGKIDATKFPRIAPILIELLKDENAQVRSCAAAAIGEFGAEAESAVPVLIEAVRKDESVNISGMISLGKIGTATQNQTIEDYFIESLGPTVPLGIRCRAAGKLGSVVANKPNPKRAIKALMDSLDDTDWQVRLLAAASLGNIGPAARNAVPALTKSLSDDEQVVRKSAAEALTKIRSPDN